MEEIIRLQEYEPLWDEWRVEKLLYEGNLSNVYQVKNKDNIGVIKVISVPKIQSETGNSQNMSNQEQMNNYFREVVEVLENELSKLSGLESIPNILTYKKYQAFERRSEIGFDFVLLMDKEQSLLEYVAGKKITNEEIVRIVKEVAEILEKAHKKDIIHKDIKVENIFIGENQESILGDFVLARKVESFQSRSYRKMDNIYTAPEVMSEYDYSVATDIFALGMVLYLLLNNGQIPDVCKQRSFRTEVPKPERAGEKLAGIALKAISYRAKDRYTSAEEFYNALCELTQEDLAYPADYAEAELARQRIQEEKERQQREEEARRAEEERLRQEEEARRAEEERLRQEEIKRAEEERQRQEEEARRAEEEERLRQEEIKRAEEERQRQEEEARRAEEERLQVEMAEQEDLKKTEEEHQRQEEIRRAEEERSRIEEEVRRAEQERQRIEEAAKRAEEERQRVEEAARRAEEERHRIEEEARRAEEEYRRMEAERIQKEKIYSEGGLDGAATHLKDTISDMEHISGDFNGQRASIENQREEKLEKVMEESQILLGRSDAQEGGALYAVHANAAEYSGFFNFEETAAYEEKKTAKAYDQSVEQEPFEHKYVNDPKEKVSKKPFLVIMVLLMVIGGCTFLYCNETTRTKIQQSYEKALEYLQTNE